MNRNDNQTADRKILSRRTDDDPPVPVSLEDAEPTASAVREDGSVRRRRVRRTSPGKTPIVTYTMLAILIVVFVAMVIVGHGDINSVGSLFGWKENALIRQGQWWRLITPMFLHGSVLHILFNGFSLYVFGGQMEQIYGSRKYFLIYVFAGITGNLASYWLSPTASLGASGALFGLVGAGLVFPLRWRGLIREEARSAILRQLAPIAIINLAIGFSSGGYIDNWAHLGGMVGGGFAALFLLPEVLEEGPRSPIANLALWAATLATLALIGVAVVRQWRWATQNMPRVAFLPFPPPESNPWWSLRVPATWQHISPEVQSQSVWRSPDGSLLTFTDDHKQPQRVQQVALLMNAAGRQAAALSVDGKPARRVTVLIGPNMIDMVLIQAYNRNVILMLETSKSRYAALRGEFEAILTSVRFIHAPTIAEDNEQAQSYK